MINNNPVYEYIGFHLLKSRIVRKKAFQPKEIEIRIENIKNLKTKFSFETVVQGTESDEANFFFVFESQFRLPNSEWRKAVGGDSELASALFPVVFPFIRQSIFAATNDSYGPIFIPIIDLRGIKLSEGLKLIRKDSK
jgi:hypothetical protein